MAQSGDEDITKLGNCRYDVLVHGKVLVIERLLPERIAVDALFWEQVRAAARGGIRDRA